MSQKNLPNQELQTVIRASELVAVHLKACSANCHNFPDQVLPANTKLEIAYNVRWSKSPDSSALACYIDFTVHGTSNKTYSAIKEGNKVFEVKATIASVYKLSDKELSDSAIATFATQNALFNCYPFARETISNLTMRLGLAPVTLPLLKARPKKSKAGENITDQEPKASFG